MGLFDFLKKTGTGASNSGAETETQVKNEAADNANGANEPEPAAEARDEEPKAADEAKNEENKASAEDKAEVQGETPKAKQRIYNLIIVDESGSMGSLRNATLSGINETIGTIRQAQQDFGDKQEHYLTLVTFDSPGPMGQAVRTLIDAKPIAEVHDVTEYCPRGCTPLYDAMGLSLTALHEKIKNDADASGVVTVLTDGLENASHEYRGRQVKQLIELLKQEGWSFSYMGSAHDVKSVSDLLSIDHVMEFDHDERGTRNSWRRESSARHSFFAKMCCDFEAMEGMSMDMKRSRKASLSQNYYEERVTPEHVEQLRPNEIFVFGSNPAGHHAGGAARYAAEHFGAIEGQGSGLQGQSYAIPTTGTMQEMQMAVMELFAFASQHPELKFLVTAVGCGIAGRTPGQVAPLFEDFIRLENVALPREFWNVLGVSMGGRYY